VKVYDGKGPPILIVKPKPIEPWKAPALAGIVYQVTGQPVWVDYAIRCGGKNPSIVACRPHLAHTVNELRPWAILIDSKEVAEAVTGQEVEDLYTVRWSGGYHLIPGGRGVPYFFVEGPYMATADGFRYQSLLRDIAKMAAIPHVPEKNVKPADAIVVDDLHAANEFAARAETAEWLSVDCETYSRVGNNDFRVLSIAVCTEKTDRVWVWGEEELGDSELVAGLVRALATRPLVGQNLKYDLQAIHWFLKRYARLLPADLDDALHRNHLVTRQVAHDTQIIEKLINTEHKSNLETLLVKYGYGAHKELAKTYVDKAVADFRQISEVAASKKANSVKLTDKEELALKARASGSEKAYAYELIPRDILLEYNALDTLVTARIAIAQMDILKPNLGTASDLTHIWESVLCHAIPVFAQIETWGMLLDVGNLQANIKRMEGVSAELLEQLKRITGDPEFNPGSTQQVSKFIYGRLGVEVSKTTEKGKPSTDDSVLGAIDHEFARKLLEWRQNEKMLKTYGHGLLATVRDDQRTHSEFFLDGAATGRLSSARPNIQNQTSFSKRFWCAEHAYTHVVMDYSQQELRIAADLSGDEAMIDLFRSGQDFHMGVAKLISREAWGITPEQVGKEHRREAKTFVFGLLYGMSDSTLAKALDVTVKQASAIRKAVYGRFPKLANLVKTLTDYTKRTGASWTRWEGRNARRRNLTLISATRPDLKGAAITAKNAAFNSPIQGTANEYCTASTVKIVHEIWKRGATAKVVATIHDAIVSVVATEDLHWYIPMKREIMLSHKMENGTPLATDVQVGQCFGNLTEIEC
jgi:DNA polymerase-1